MNRILQKTILFFAVFSFSVIGQAQSEGTVQVDGYTLDKGTGVVRLSIKTTESFIVGSNRYVLHIGGKHFLRNEHPNGQLNEIVFMLPLSDYENLEAQARIVLVYGLYHENTQQDNEGSQANGFTGKHWDLGKFAFKEFESK